ncbi:MAG: 2-hydroxyacyl-CoA dehydratase family protein [Desulfatibacillaceae bacterium]|nr:2-hydroxyacyl-CoA dehydratase family protein [Desulfatibacillaceae bacterium]
MQAIWGGDIAPALKRLKGMGRPVAGCFPLYPPQELLHSMGISPVLMWGLGGGSSELVLADKRVQNFVCAVGRRLSQLVLWDSGQNLDALFACNACDTVRNLPEILEAGVGEQGTKMRWFSLHVPAIPMQEPTIKAYFANNIKQCIRELEALAPRPYSADNFLQSAALYNEWRSLGRQLDIASGKGGLPFERLVRFALEAAFTPVEESLAAGKALLKDCAPKPAPKNAVPVILSGIMPPPPAFLKVMEESGLFVCGNDLAPLWRTWARSPQPADAPEFYADFYSNHFPCSTLLPTADARPEALLGLARERGARAIVFIGEKFCEYEYFEFPYLEKFFQGQGLATLLLEFGVDDLANVAQHATRIEAFAESLAQ